MEQKRATKKLMLPCFRFEIERIHTWLEDMAAEGWILKSFNSLTGIVTFYEATAKSRKVRIEYEEIGERFTSPGGTEWRLAGALAGQIIYYSNDATDEKGIISKGSLKSAIRKGTIVKILSALAAICFVYEALAIDINIGYINFALYLPKFGTMCFVAMNILCFGLFIITAIFIISAVKRERADEKAGNATGYRQNANAFRTRKKLFLAFVLCCVVIIAGCYSIHIYYNHSDYDYDSNINNVSGKYVPPFATLTAYDTRIDMSKINRSDAKQYVCQYSNYNGIMLNKGINWWEEADYKYKGKKMTSNLDVDYYDLKTNWLAKEMVREIVRQSGDYSTAASYKKYNAAKYGVDIVYVVDDVNAEKSDVSVVVKKGTKVMYAQVDYANIDLDKIFKTMAKI